MYLGYRGILITMYLRVCVCVSLECFYFNHLAIKNKQTKTRLPRLKNKLIKIDVGPPKLLRLVV